MINSCLVGCGQRVVWVAAHAARAGSTSRVFIAGAKVRRRIHATSARSESLSGMGCFFAFFGAGANAWAWRTPLMRDDHRCELAHPPKGGDDKVNDASMAAACAPRVIP
jgi:hypothetical protein